MGVKRKRGGVHLFVVLNDDVVIDALTLWNENKLFSYVPPPPPTDGTWSHLEERGRVFVILVLLVLERLSLL